jgi:matrixin
MDTFKAGISLVIAISLAAPSTAGALELGIQDHNAPLAQMNDWASQTGATWERIVVDLGDDTVPDKIRASHAAGRKVILTVGGNGTGSRRPSFTAALDYIATLPQADRYTIGNEPDMDGVKPCSYQRGWIKARRTLGHRLLFGDFSPHRPLSYTAAVLRCGHLPKHLDFAVHPYQPDDPLTHTTVTSWSQGALGNLRASRTSLRNLGIRVDWWLTEFGYGINFAGMTISDERAGWLWPRAIRQARRVDAKVLMIYTGQGSTWDTRPGDQAWRALRSAANTPHERDWTIAELLPVARVPWKGSHCYGRERIVLEPRAVMPDIDGWVASIGDPGCVVHLADDLSAARTCGVLTHELGHLAGVGHSQNPNSVMYPTSPMPRRCEQFLPARDRSVKPD